MTFHQLSKGATGWLAAATLLALPALSVAEEEAETTSASSSVSVGTAPGQPTIAGSDSSTGAPPMTLRTSTQNWEFGFHGYLRAPLRMSFDTQPNNTYPLDADGVPDTSQAPVEGEDWRFHMSPALVDGVYTDWKYTNSMGGPWAEMMFSYGNSIAVGNVSVATYNITDSGWRNLQSQLGINQAFVTLNFPRAFKSRGGLVWNVGVFDNRYGSAGRYDAGRYDTYIVGRTHTAGETLTAKIDLTDKLVLVLEHGFGAKSDVLGGNPKADLDPSNRGSTFAWVPYNGQEGQLPAMVNHAHAGLVFHTFKWWKELQINGHFMHAFTNSADPSNDYYRQWPYQQKDGLLMIGGAEVKFNGALFGDLYLGFSHAKTDGLYQMPDTIELLHSQGGWSLLKNFYGDMVLQDTTPETSGSSFTSRDGRPNPGTGKINTLAWQYQLSLARLLWGLQDKDFWGQGPDFTLTTWGMFNTVTPDKSIEPYLKRWAKKKMKFGFEGMYTPIKYLGFGLRMDRVIPDMDYSQETQADRDLNAGTLPSYAPFTVLSPKLQIKTAFVTHEEVNIQFSHYFWNKNNLTEDEYRNAVRAENPYEGQPSDRNALMISVNMWW